ncbi:MAG: hypothetical protein PHV18_14175 [Lachnospiraceae bacterium]|nr:hypothetical protein [Lachnospiraceae bacterium]
MHGKDILVVHIPASSVTQGVLFNQTNLVSYASLDTDDEEGEYFDGDIDLFNDLDGSYVYASSSNATSSNTLLTEVQPDTYEYAVVDRLNIISISSILITCLLFLILIRRG